MNNEQQAEQPKTKRIELDLHPSRAELIRRLNGEVQRLQDRPDVVALAANQTCLDAFMRVEVSAAGMEMPDKPHIAVEPREGGKFALVIVAQE